jgi:hypothetical protein
MIDMIPIINLLITTVAPGTWENRYESQWDAAEMELGIPRPLPDSSTVSNKPKGVIVPFYLSISLIVRSTPDVHMQVGTTLRALRQLLSARDNRTAEHHQADKPKFSPTPPPGDPKLPAPKALPANSVVPASRPRVQELLEELQKEIEKLPRDRE